MAQMYPAALEREGGMDRRERLHKARLAAVVVAAAPAWRSEDREKARQLQARLEEPGTGPESGPR